MSALLKSLIREIVQEELLKGRNKKELIRALAQDIIDEVRPGEMVQEILINTNSAESIEEVIEQAAEIIEDSKKQPSPKKTVYTIMFNSSTGPYPSREQIPNQFDSIGEAVEKVMKANAAYPHYFVLQHEVDV